MITVKQIAGTSSVEIRFFNTTDHDWPFCDFDLNPHNPSVVLRLVSSRRVRILDEELVPLSHEKALLHVLKPNESYAMTLDIASWFGETIRRYPTCGDWLLYWAFLIEIPDSEKYLDFAGATTVRLQDAEQVAPAVTAATGS